LKEGCNNAIISFETVSKEESDQLTIWVENFARFVSILDLYHLD